MGGMFFIVYRMGRLCERAHEISGIKAPCFLRGWLVGGLLGWMGGLAMVGWWLVAGGWVGVWVVVGGSWGGGDGGVGGGMEGWWGVW